MSLQDVGGEILAATSRTAPPVAVTGAVVAGWGLPEWVLVATLVSTILNCIYLVYKMTKRDGDGRE